MKQKTLLSKIPSILDSQAIRVFKPEQLESILIGNLDINSPPLIELIQKLLKETSLRRIRIPSNRDHEPSVRYLWSEPSPYEVALSLKPGSFLSHSSAIFIHGLNDFIPSRIYLNKEQSKNPKKMKTSIKLTQEAISIAFSKRPRESQYEYVLGKQRILIVQGKNSGNIGCIDLEIDEYLLRVTSLERTLIDATVRPFYAGGTFQVLAAYEGAREMLNPEAMVEILKTLDYSYPYHQSIGFYLERAGYPESATSLFAKENLSIDFFLDHGLNELNREYNSRWRIFYPKGL